MAGRHEQPENCRQRYISSIKRIEIKLKQSVVIRIIVMMWY